MIFKRGGVYHFEFLYKGRRHRGSTHLRNKNDAGKFEAARKTQLALGEVGLADKPRVPTFKEFIPRFERAIETLCAGKPKTISFYQGRLPALSAFPAMQASPLDAINEELIEGYKRSRSGDVSKRGKRFAVSTINRELATLRRLLRLAQEWKVIARVPRIRLFGGEVNREYVLSYADEARYLHMAPDPLRDVAALILDTGVRPGEALALRWEHVQLEPARASKFGYLRVNRGKSPKAARNLSLTARIAAMLASRKKAGSGASFVFPGERGGSSFQVTSLDHQHLEFRTLLGLPAEFVLHSLRHTMLTRLGESGADAFTIMRIAGHSSVTVSQRYVHPSPEALELAFERLDAMNTARRSKVPTKSTTPAKKKNRKNPAKSHKINTMGA